MAQSGGFSQARLARIGDVMRDYVERGEVAGVVALVARREAVHVEAIGVQDFTSGAPMRRDSIAASPGSYGWSGGFGTSFVADPAEEMVAVLLIQRLMSGADDAAINQAFLTLAYQAIDD